MPLTIAYHCTQQQLYAIFRLGWNAVTDFLTDFTAFKGKYIAAFVTARLADIDAAEALPDQEQRNEDSRTLRVNLKNKATECLNLWQRTKRYITEAYPEDQLEIKLDAAGQGHYRRASQDDWSAAQRLMLDGNTFILANTADLTAGGNMPAAFAATFTTAKTEYDTLYNDFLNAGQNDEIETQTKITANNEIHKQLMSMFLDGQEIFKTNEAVKKLFTFDQVLLTVAGPGIAGARGSVKDSVTGQLITVVASLQFTGPTNMTVTTNEDSRFEASPLATGSYMLVVTAEGYEILQITEVDIETGTIKTLNIILTPLP